MNTASTKTKTLREERAWSQEQLAGISGVNVRTVQRVERGEPASAESLKAIASAFKVDVSDLLKADISSSTRPPVSFLVRIVTGTDLFKITAGTGA